MNVKNVMSPDQRGRQILEILNIKEDEVKGFFTSCGNDCGKIYLCSTHDVSILEKTNIPFKCVIERRDTKIILHF